MSNGAANPPVEDESHLDQRTISDAEIRAATHACRCALSARRRRYPNLRFAHHFAYAVTPSVIRGRPALFVVTAAGEACALTPQLLEDMAKDEDATAAWLGPVPVILLPVSATGALRHEPMTELPFSAAPAPPCDGLQFLVKMRGELKAADGRTLVLTRRSPWTCLPAAFSPFPDEHDDES